jgi:hypothetical protein
MVNSFTFWNGANATRDMTVNLNGTTDPVITFSDGATDVTAGVLRVGGSDVATATNNTTFSNKTIDAGSNTITVQQRIAIPVAGCNNATAGPVWDLPTSAAAVPACVTGTNTQKGVLDFADASNLSFQFHYPIPSTWNGTNMTISGKWFTTATSGDVVWQVRCSCTADGEVDDPSWDTDILAITDTAKGTTNQANDFSGTLLVSSHLSPCAAGELLNVQVFRDAGHASDSLAATARLLPMELMLWVVQ